MYLVLSSPWPICPKENELINNNTTNIHFIFL
jgi:hypothetical protein